MDDLKTSQVKERIIETLIDSGGELFEYDSKDVQHLVNDHSRLLDVIFKTISEIDEQIEKLHHKLNELGAGISEYKGTQIDSKLDAYYNCKQLLERIYKGSSIGGDMVQASKKFYDNLNKKNNGI